MLKYVPTSFSIYILPCYSHRDRNVKIQNTQFATHLITRLLNLLLNLELFQKFTQLTAHSNTH